MFRSLFISKFKTYSILGCFALNLSVFLLLTVACTKNTSKDIRVISANELRGLQPEEVLEFAKLSPVAEFDLDMELIKVDFEQQVKLGGQTLVHLSFRMLEDWGGDTQIKLFVHGVVPGGKLRVAGSDQKILKGHTNFQQAKRGDIIEETFIFKVPKNISADQIDIRIGFFKANKRYKVISGKHDGDNRFSIGMVKVIGAPKTFKEVTALYTEEVLKLDGVLSEQMWSTAQRIGPFISYNGVSRVKNKTFARLAYGKDALYLAIEAADDDIHSPYLKRDDKLYNSEAVEIFIDADGDRDDYIELQTSPNNLHFDASFKGGARKNFNTKFNANYETFVDLQGSFNQNNDKDVAWITEWKIPYAEIPDLKSPPKKGDRWRINLFRLDRPRQGTKVVGNEATAWSSPYSGDFHNLERFGILIFGQ